MPRLNPPSRGFAKAMRDYNAAILDGMAKYLWVFAVSNFSEADRDRKVAQLRRTRDPAARVDFSEIRGNQQAVRAAVEAVWRHQNLLLWYDQNETRALSIARRIGTIVPFYDRHQLAVVRMPHSSITPRALVAETHLAAGGALYLGDLDEWMAQQFEFIARTLRDWTTTPVDPVVTRLHGPSFVPAVRPTPIIVTSAHKTRGGDATTRDAYRDRLLSIIKFPVESYVTDIAPNDLIDQPPNPPSMELRAQIRRRAGDFHYAAPPAAVSKAAKELGKLYAQDTPLVEMFAMAMEIDTGKPWEWTETGTGAWDFKNLEPGTSEAKRYERDRKLEKAEEFGTGMAAEACGDFMNGWFNRHVKFEVAVPHFHIHYDGATEIVWEGDLPGTTRVARTDHVDVT